MEGYLAEIRIFGGNFAPMGWSFCNGAQLSINNNEALYTLIGTTYGGDGVQTFNLPDLRGRVPIGAGQRPGEPLFVLGQLGGTETASMSINQMPAHTHTTAGATVSIGAYNGTGDTGSPSGNVLAKLDAVYSTLASDSKLKAMTSAITIQNAGQSLPFSIIQPYLATNYIICVQGIFPSRN